MDQEDKLAPVHEAIGEFVVIFQWAEDLYRQIGWYILDPTRSDWPPKALRKETNHDLIEKVVELFEKLPMMYGLPEAAAQAAEFRATANRLHELRKYRNRLLHSAYIELKAGGESHGYLRAGTKLAVDPDTGELMRETEGISPKAIRAVLTDYGDALVRLSIFYKQLIHWLPVEAKDPD